VIFFVGLYSQKLGAGAIYGNTPNLQTGKVASSICGLKLLRNNHGQVVLTLVTLSPVKYVCPRHRRAYCIMHLQFLWKISHCSSLHQSDHI